MWETPSKKNCACVPASDTAFSSCKGNVQYCSSTRMTILLAGERRREKEKTLLYNLLQCKMKNSLQGTARTGSNLVHLSFSLSWLNRHCWSSLLQPRKVKMNERWQKKPPNRCILNHIQHPLRAGCLAITIKFIPFKTETELPAKTMCVKRSSFSFLPPSTRTGIFIR